MNSLLVGLRIIKKVRKTYGKDGNRHLRKEINPLLVGLRIMKRVQEAYSRDSNEHL